MGDIAEDEPLAGVRAETLELINTEVTANLAQQADESARLEAKALVLVGYAGALSAFLATRVVQTVLATVAYAAYGLAASSGIVVFMIVSGSIQRSAPRRCVP